MSDIHDLNLNEVLIKANDDDLSLLIDIITDNGKGRISLSSSSCQQLLEAKETGIDDYSRELIAEELTRFGGNSIMNFLRRGTGVTYKEILEDVGARVKIVKLSHRNCTQLEMAILAKVLEQTFDRMDEKERASLFNALNVKYMPGMGALAMASVLTAIKSTGFSSRNITSLVAAATMNNLLGRTAVSAAASAPLGKALGLLTGPLGWAITGIWTAFDLASPAFRVTVPCVIQIAHIRHKLLSELTCEHCYAPIAESADHCSGCGAYRQIKNELLVIR